MENFSLQKSRSILSELKNIVDLSQFKQHDEDYYIEQITDMINKNFECTDPDVSWGTNELIKLVIQMMIGYPVVCMLGSYFIYKDEKLCILLITQTGGYRKHHYHWLNNIIISDPSCINHYDQSQSEHLFYLDLLNLLRIKPHNKK